MSADMEKIGKKVLSKSYPKQFVSTVFSTSGPSMYLKGLSIDHPCMLKQTLSSNGSTPTTSFCTAVSEINTSVNPLKLAGNVTVPKVARGTPGPGLVFWFGYSYSYVTLAAPERLLPTKRTVQPFALLVSAPLVTRQARRRDVRVKVSLGLPVEVVLICRAGEPP